MAERRPLTEGIKPPAPLVDPKREAEFVYAGKARGAEPPSAAATTNLSRSPLSTRVRSDFAAALKRASLERQLNGTEPSTLQDILEQAIEPWLKANGYLP